MNEEIIERVRKFVEEESKKCFLGMELFLNHVIFVVDYSKRLARKFGADEEIVEIAAWFHDIGSIVCGRENHHLTGAEIAEKKLREFDYSEDKIKKIKYCILAHRGSVGELALNPEERVLVEADCLACFDSLEGQFLWVIERDGIKEQRRVGEIVRQKFENKWNQLSEEGKEIVRDKWEAINLLLG